MPLTGSDSQYYQVTDTYDGRFGTKYQDKYDDWQCYECKLWFRNSVAHGHTSKFYADKDKENFPDKQTMFLFDKRNQQIQRAWKKDQYAKVKAQIRL